MMRLAAQFRLATAFALSLPVASALPALADDPSAANAVRALIKRHGGSGAGDRWRCGTVAFTTSEGVIPPEMGTATVTEVFEFPHKFKRTLTADTPQGKLFMTFVINEDGGWMIAPGRPAVEIDGSFADRDRHSFADIMDVAILEAQIPKMRLAGNAERGGEDTICLELESEELGSCKYFVSSQSGLLVEHSRTAPDPTTGVATTMVTRLGKYKEIDGIPVPMSISATANGKKLLSVEIQTLTFKESMPPSTFAAPK